MTCPTHRHRAASGRLVAVPAGRQHATRLGACGGRVRLLSGAQLEGLGVNIGPAPPARDFRMQPFTGDLVLVGGRRPRTTACRTLIFSTRLASVCFQGGPVAHLENRHGRLWVGKVNRRRSASHDLTAITGLLSRVSGFGATCDSRRSALSGTEEGGAARSVRGSIPWQGTKPASSRMPRRSVALAGERLEAYSRPDFLRNALANALSCCCDSGNRGLRMREPPTAGQAS
jgi:hypothetical protein